MYVLTAFLVFRVVFSLHKFWRHVIGNSIECFPISFLKTSAVIGSDLK